MKVGVISLGTTFFLQRKIEFRGKKLSRVRDLALKFGLDFGRARNWVNVLRCSITVRVCASRVCCLNIVVKLGNSSIFK